MSRASDGETEKEPTRLPNYDVDGSVDVIMVDAGPLPFRVMNVIIRATRLGLKEAKQIIDTARATRGHGPAPSPVMIGLTMTQHSHSLTRSRLQVRSLRYTTQGRSWSCRIVGSSGDTAYL
jgi:hypothetical protein